MSVLYYNARVLLITMNIPISFSFFAENNLRPNLTYDTVPFVGDPVSFTCELDFDLWPSFLYITPQYKWSVRENIQQNTFIIIPVAMSDKGKTVGGNIQQNTLIIDPVAMSDKGKTVYCSVNVDNMNIADVSNEILLDPYCMYSVLDQHICMLISLYLPIVCDGMVVGFTTVCAISAYQH